MTYIAKESKNGKMQYFRIDEDGKKKIVKRSEYEANMTSEGQGQLDMDTRASSEEPTFAAAPAETKATVKTADGFTAQQTEAMEVVKSIIASTGNTRTIKFYSRKNYCEVNYRSCTVCAFPRGENNEVTAIRFWGLTAATRMETSDSPLADTAAIFAFTRQIEEQLEYIDRISTKPWKRTA